jgi:hypothetical protein
MLEHVQQAKGKEHENKKLKGYSFSSIHLYVEGEQQERRG